MSISTTAYKAIALLFVLIGTFCLTSHMLNPRLLDFVSFWTAARLTIDGNIAAIYSLDAHWAVQREMGIAGGHLPFAYPPIFLFALLPFAAMPYGIATICWVVTTALLYFTTIARYLSTRFWQIAAFPAVLANVVMAQAGFLLAAIFILGSAMLSRRPIVSGIIFGMLVVKPQLAVLVPLALIAARQWHALFSAACSAAFIVIASMVVFGPGIYGTLADAMPGYSEMAFSSPLAWRKMVSLYAALRFHGVPAGTAWFVHLGVAAAAAAAVYHIWRGAYAMQAKLAVLSAATILVSPYMFTYDLVILAFAIHWLSQGREGRLFLPVLWIMTSLHLAQSWGFIDFPNIYAAATVATLVLILCQIGVHWRWMASASIERHQLQLVARP